MLNIFTLLYPDIQQDLQTADLLARYVRRQVLPKGAMLATEGEINTRLYLIETGLARVYYETETETTAWLITDGRFALVPGSFFDQRPSRQSIQLLESSVVHSISYDELQLLYSASPLLNIVARRVLEQYVQQYEWRLRVLRTRSAEGRYALFTQQFSPFMNRLQGKHIASFLGITKYTLSRLRAKK